MSAYLDHAASTPMRPEAVDAMLPYFRDHPANPSGAHTMARDARKAIDQARDDLAELLGADPREIVFTSGGTEADNLAVFGVHDRMGGVVVGSAVEHHAVLEPIQAREGRLLPVGGRGIVDLDALVGILDEIQRAGDHVTLVSVMLANNEVGTVQPMKRIIKLIRAHAPDAVVHTDAVQAMPWLDVAKLTRTADLVSISAHKFGGPKGVGALVVREGVASRIAARTVGGGQERERRSGTPNVAGIVAMSTAARLVVGERAATVARVGALRDRLADGLVSAVADLYETGMARPTAISAMSPRPDDEPQAEPIGPVATSAIDALADDDLVDVALTEDRGALGIDRSHKVAGSCHVCIEGVESESLLYLLEKDGVYAAAASSCASGAMQPSHVLSAMGVPPARAHGSLRLSLGAESTAAEIDLALDVIPAAVTRLRERA